MKFVWVCMLLHMQYHDDCLEDVQVSFAYCNRNAYFSSNVARKWICLLADEDLLSFMYCLFNKTWLNSIPPHLGSATITDRINSVSVQKYSYEDMQSKDTSKQEFYIFI